MINRANSILFSSAGIAGLLFFSPPAHAELDACGGIYLTASSDCKYKPKEECMTECTTTTAEESCVSQLYNDCETSCTTTATNDCETTCTSSCMDSCTTSSTTQEGTSASELCLNDCQSGADQCGSAAHPEACGRCEKHNCNKRCEEKCGDPDKPTKITSSTECMATCGTACTGSCTAKVNTQCQVDCQEKTYTQCETQTVQNCQTECKDKGGAIFCDGQFVKATDANDCADELDVKLNIDIRASIKAATSATASVANTACTAVKKNCSVANVGGDDSQGAFGLVGLIVGLTVWRVKRRRGQG